MENEATRMPVLADFVHEFRRHKGLADRAMTELDDESFFRRPGAEVNSIALIVKHLAGNLVSRWADFLTSDGEKPYRNRDSEFTITEQDTRTNLCVAWEHGWSTLFDTFARLTEPDFTRTVTIRGEPHTVFQALLRSATHVAYHTGQILYVARLLRPENTWLTIAPGQSHTHQANYLGTPRS
jgi:uncharacterized damage-inducible protein DinB